MIKQLLDSRVCFIVILIILLCFTGLSGAGDVLIECETAAYSLPVNNIGGTNTITPHHHYYDDYFSLYNNGGVSYAIYQYDYIGVKEIAFTDGINRSYRDSFIGNLQPNQIIMLNNNASYRIYATSPVLSGVTVEKIEKRFNQYWFVGILIIIILIIIIKIWRELVK